MQPGTAERQQLKFRQQAAEEVGQKADAEKKAASKKAGEEARKHAGARTEAEQKLCFPTVIALRGFPATDSVSLVPVRYSVAGVGSITLDEPITGQTRRSISNVLTELGCLLSSIPVTSSGSG